MAGVVTALRADTGSAQYEIIVGDEIIGGEHLSRALAGSRGVAVVMSARVDELHGPRIRTALTDLTGCQFFIMDDAERNKNYHYAESFLEGFIAAGLSRKSAVVAVGGGVVGDFAGYLAALYMRGIPVIQVPTTLLAMVDSSIGGKVAVNLSVGKNLVGAFHQPSLVLSDVSFLDTLPDAEVRNGLAEALKHGLIGDEETLRILEEHDLQSVRDRAVMATLVSRSAAFKAGVVSSDEREGGLRMVLNYGHTVGHAVESAMEHRGISHGEAVALGIAVKIDAGRAMGMIDDVSAERILRLLDRYGLVPRGLCLDPDELMTHMAYDKKNVGDTVNFVMLQGVGNPVINRQIEGALLREILVRWLV